MADWARVRIVFEEALDQAVGEREAFLARACAGDADLRAEVENLLAADEVQSEAWDPLTPQAVSTFVAKASMSGTVLAGYRLERVIGAGGMGTVYVARQESPDRRVALKLLNLASFGEDRVRRFEIEAELLGQLRHPNIAQVYASGVASVGDEDGALRVPFIAMELVEDARDVVAYSRELDLGIEARLRLLRDVADAVVHAHGRGVIHRDLKRGNLLVDGEGRVKVIDFGIARSQGGRSGMTRTGVVLGTLETMAPEQLRGEVVDARADVYGLGSVLYELLTGRPPVDVANVAPAEAARRLLEAEVVPPSRLGHGLPPELDWITGRALEKDADRRYASAAELAADLDRLRNHEPLSAGPPSRAYRARVFARRHRVAVTAFVLVMSALALGLGFSAWGLVRATEAEQRAQEQLERATRRGEELGELNAFLRRVLTSPTPAAAGHDVRVVDVLDRAATALDAQGALRPELELIQREALAEAYHALGVWDRGLREATRAAALSAAHGHDSPERERLVTAIRTSALIELRRPEEARALVTAWSKTAASPEDAELGQLLLGQVLVAEGAARDAREVLEPLVATWREREPPPERLPNALTSLAQALHATGSVEEALAVSEENVRLRTERDGRGAPATAFAIAELALLSIDTDPVRAAELLSGELERQRSAYGPAHPWTLQWQTNLAVAEARSGRAAAARARVADAVRVATDAYGEAHPTTLEVLDARAGLLFVVRDLDAAQDAYERWIDLARAVLGEDHPDVVRQVRLAALLLQVRGRLDESVEFHGAALERLQAAGGAGEALDTMRRDHEDIAAMADERRRDAGR